MYYVIVGIPLLYTWNLAINFAHRSGSPYWASWALLSFLAHLSVVVFLTPIRGESWWWMNLVKAHRLILGSLLWHSVLALMAVAIATLTGNLHNFWLCTSVSLTGYSFYWNGRVIENEKQNWYSAMHPATGHAPTAMPRTTERRKKPADGKKWTTDGSKPPNGGLFRLWWDFENMSFTPEEIRTLVSAMPGTVVPGFSVSDPRRVTKTQTKALYDMKVPCILAPDTKKQASDKVLRSTMRMADVGPSIIEVLISNDGHFTPEVTEWGEKGAKVWVITNDKYSRRLVCAATWHTRAGNLLGKKRSHNGPNRCKYCGAKVREYWTWCGNCRSLL